MAFYITSDIHIMHKRMIGPDALVKTRRHFSGDENEFLEYMVKAHNRVVKPEDTTYNLGDISLFNNNELIMEYLKRLNGQIVIVKGNHDSSKLMKYLKNNNYKISGNRDKFILHDVGVIVKKDAKVYHLTHYPMSVGVGTNNLRNFCGHIHELAAPSITSLNVGVDSVETIDYQDFGEPIRFELAQELLEAKVEAGKKELGIKDKSQSIVKETFITRLLKLLKIR